MTDRQKQALAKFLTVSQAPLSMLIGMPGGAALGDAWGEVRDAFGLRGWHTEAEALTALEKL